MALAHAPLAQGRRAPWANGAGVTTELWRLDDGAGGFEARVSVAEVSGAQPFSAFPGMERALAPLDGPPIVLTIDGRVHRPTIGEALRFAGEAVAACVVEGAAPALDLNLMWRRDRFVGAMTPLALGPGETVTLTPTASERVGLFALDPCALIAPRPLALGRHDLVIGDEAFVVVAEAPARGFVLRLTPRPGA